VPKSPSAQEPECPCAQVYAQEPNCPGAQVPKCPSAQEPKCLSNQVPKCPRAQVPNCPFKKKQNGQKSLTNKAVATQIVLWPENNG
jgi:hypothetical protein